MRILTSAKYALGVTAAVAVLAACSGGSGSQIAPTSPMTGNAVVGGMHSNGHSGKSYAITMKAVAHGQLKHYKSWFQKNANKNRLIYVSDFNNSLIQVYNYPSQGTQNPPAGTITADLLNPQGMCVKNNQVIVANTGDNNLVGYNYGSTTPDLTLSDPGEYPVGCAVAPNGDVAASDIFSPTTGEGAVTVWAGGSGTGTIYVEPAGMIECFFISYDGSGNLYVDGFNSSGYFGMAYLPAGSSTWQSVSLSGATINFPGGVIWDGTYLTVEDQSGPSGYPVVYQCNNSGASLDCSVGSTGLQGASDVTQGYIKRGVKGITGADASAGTVYTWAYPAGGSPRPNKTIHVSETYPSLNGTAVQLGPT